MATTLARLLFTCAALVGLCAHAQDIEIPCAGSPPEAVLNVPAPADRFVHVLCTKYGHVLAPTAGWFWTPPGKLSPTFYPAQMVRSGPREVGNAIYFKSVRVNSLEGSEAVERWQLIGRVFKDPAPAKALEIVAASSSGSSHTIYIFPNAWGYSCSPTCAQDAAFIMVPENKQPPTW